VSNPFDLLATLAYPLVSALTWLTEPVFGTAAAAAAIVLGTLVVRLLLVPAGYAQHRADLRRADVLQRIAAISARHQGDKPRQQSELAAIYRSEGGGLLRGFLPMLVQLPIVAGLYRLFSSSTIQGHANTLLHHTLFGVPLGTHLFAADGPQLIVFAVLLVLLAGLGFASSRLLRPRGAQPTGAAAVLARVVPYAPMATLLFLPLAASLYVVTSSAWMLVQTLVLRGR